MQLDSINKVLENIDNIVSKAMRPAMKLPDIVVWFNSMTRSGSSSYEVLSRIFMDLAKINPALGSDTNTDGQPNMIKMVINSIIKHEHDVRRENEVIHSVIPTGALNLSVIGNKATNLTPTGFLGVPYC